MSAPEINLSPAAALAAVREKIAIIDMLTAATQELEDLRKKVEWLEGMVPEVNDDLIRASWMRRHSPDLWESIGRMAAAEWGQDQIAESVRATSDTPPPQPPSVRRRATSDPANQ